MSLRKTTEQFIEQSNKIHNYKYDYSKSNYVSSFKKVIIICHIHGEFLQVPHDHTQGNGCQKCASERTSKFHSMGLEVFIKKANKVHNNKFTYNNVNYINNRTKVLITCKHHGDFPQEASSHLQGFGCPQCNWDLNNNKKEDWIKKAKGKTGTFYIIRCYNENEEFYKFGITFRGTSVRYKSKADIPYNYEIVKEVITKNLSYIWDLEKKFKYIKRNNHYKPLIKFNGARYECFK